MNRLVLSTSFESGMNIAPFLAAWDVMTTVIQQISPSKPHEALNPTYHPRYPSSALPIDTPTFFLLEDQCMEKIWLFGLANAILTANREGYDELTPFLPISTATSRRSGGMKSLYCHFTSVSHTVVEMF